MKTTFTTPPFILLLLLVLGILWVSDLHIPTAASAVKKPYLVYLERDPHHEYSENHVLDSEQISETHQVLLSSSIQLSQEKAKEAILYSYSSIIHGFAALLEEEEARKLSGHPGVISVVPTKKNRLQTTRSWEFMGLEDSNGGIPDDSIWKAADFGEGVIIANIDTGVWPESPSFTCTVEGDIPSKWRGICDTSGGFKCNGNLIGARYFNRASSAEHNRTTADNSALDIVGHGTLTLCTAAGCFVPGANLLGSANGTAKGGSPKAWVAAYKVSPKGDNADDADILAGLEAAIQDGVDVISISMGTGAEAYSEDVIAIGSFHAVKEGITVVAAAGNYGKFGSSTVFNDAPWILTVAASSLDRRFESNVILGNGQKFKGISYNTNTLPAGKFHPLIKAVDARASEAYPDDARYCNSGTLEPSKVKGKIVLCHGSVVNVENTLMISQMGGVGVIIVYPHSHTEFPEPHHLPTSVVSGRDGNSIVSYLATTKCPVAYISGGTVVGETVEAPVMASFSSIGPNPFTPEILKPDVTAPGVGILAGYSEAIGPDGISDNRRVPFNIGDGTSFSCPHVAGIAGLVRSVHPDWSPAAIKSAIMTTEQQGTSNRTSSGLSANPFNYGAGHVLPNKATDPGLVYDMTLTDYLDFLCYIGYNAKQLSKFYHKSYQCPNKTATSLSNLNYPSITISELPIGAVITVSRTLKNVGSPGLYTATIKAPTGILVKVDPSCLDFKQANEEKKFQISIQDVGSAVSGYEFGELTWSDGVHDVRSPIVLKKKGKNGV